MTKSADAFRTISEVSDLLGTPAHVLRFWESRFSQIKPVKRAGGRRYYRPADVALLGGIRRLLHDDGLTIRGVQKLLRERGVRHVAAMGGFGDAEMEATSAFAGDVTGGFAENFADDDLVVEEIVGEDLTKDIGAHAHPADTTPDDGTVVDGYDSLVPQDDIWPETAAPEAAGAEGGLAPDPGEAGVPNDIFSAPPPRNTTPWDILTGPRAMQPAGEAARADLGRARANQMQLTRNISAADYREVAPPVDAPMPAAALLRAMTSVKAAERRSELRAIYGRLEALHARRGGTNTPPRG